MSDISTRNLHLSYGSKTIIEDLSIDLASGGIISLIGPNGSGKSTLLKSLARLLPPHRGSVLLDGKDIQHLPTRQVAQKLAILPQSPTAPEGLRRFGTAELRNIADFIVHVAQERAHEP